MELTDVALDYRIWNSLRSAEDLARAVIRAATRGDFYFFPPGEDLRLWWLKRLMPVRTLKLVGKKGVRMGRPSRIHIALSSRAGVLEKVQVGGEAVVVGEGTIRA
jgi:hypothetical protein